MKPPATRRKMPQEPRTGCYTLVAKTFQQKLSVAHRPTDIPTEIPLQLRDFLGSPSGKITEAVVFLKQVSLDELPLVLEGMKHLVSSQAIALIAAWHNAKQGFRDNLAGLLWQFGKGRNGVDMIFARHGITTVHAWSRRP